MRQIKGEAFVSTGYSPIIAWHVTDFDEVYQKIEKYGGILDGEMEEIENLGKIASFRSPDGHMMALREIKGT